ncbi:MAG: PilZ domain-containing protein [Bdellovibrio sp.]|nr:PilZ domain-containing protein [Bdellovibrio sp.]
MEQTHLYQPVNSSNEIKRLIKLSIKKMSPTYLWTGSDKNTIRVSFYEGGPNPYLLHVWVPKDINREEFHNRIDCYFNVALNDSNIYFKTPCIGSTKDGLIFQVPKKTYKLQRRKKIRLPLLDIMDVLVQFPDPEFNFVTLHRPILDLSEGGLSFLISHFEREKFKKGSTIDKMIFSLNNTKLLFKAEVVYTQELQEGSKFTGVKVGVQFSHLKVQDKQALCQNILDLSQKYFSDIV